MKNNITQFESSVYAACKRIPKGKVSTYGEIARAIGKPKAARAVGNALNKNPFAPKVPCHRVIKSTGFVGGFASGCKSKMAILKREGVIVQNGKVLDFAKRVYRFKK